MAARTLLWRRTPPGACLAWSVAVLIGIWLGSVSLSAGPVLRVVAAAPGTALLGNGSFEQAAAGKPRGWEPAPKGYALAPAEGRGGSQALRCENGAGEGWFGASQVLVLNRTHAEPLRVRGWSKAENVAGSSDNDYSLYVDLIYADGTPLWGQTANFRTGTHDWEARELVIVPEKPVRSLTVYCLFRGHAGRVWFDDVSLEELQGGAALFQGVPVQPADVPRATAGAAVDYRTEDGLSLALRAGQVVSLRVDGRECAGSAPSGFLVRDAAANSDFFAFTNGACPELGLKVESDYCARAGHVVVQGRLTDTRRQDRAVTLVFALPLDALGWRWGDDVRRSRPIAGAGDFSNTVSVRCGATGTMSLYPLAAVHDDRTGLALALDLAQPAVCRLGYHAGTRQLYVAYDFGLVPDTARFPGGAEFRFVLYRFEPRWGFRAAYERFMVLFPDFFQVRAKEQGLWMPFTDVGTVQGWEDFGFKFHEGNNRVAWDDAHGVLSFRYTEPMTWWMRMGRELPRTLPSALRVRDELARNGQGQDQRLAAVSQVAAMFDEAGQPSLLFRDTPWCNGAVWSLNPNPHLPVPASTPAGGSAPRSERLNAATVYWNDALRQSLYGPEAPGRLDGEYLDSLEGYVTAELNFRREHFRYTTVPLTFASDTKQPALFKGLAVFEFTRWLAQDVHRLGKLMFANGVPYRFACLCPWLDVLGTETDWLSQGQYRPASDAQMSLWRTLSGAKPYLLLMNTDYNAFTSDLVERYFQRCLFYGMFPGMFSHNAADNPYWQNPKWYNRDRAQFKRYLPLIRRVAQAGWQPVTGAVCDNSNLFLERFGPDPEGTVFFTVLNDTATSQRGRVRAELDRLHLAGPVAVRQVLNGTDGWEVELQPQQALVLEVRAGTTPK